MDFLNFFSRTAPADPHPLHFGTFTVDRNGRLVSSTLPNSFPSEQIAAITTAVIETFQEAGQTNLPLREVYANFGCMKMTARELRGGALVFLAPRHSSSTRFSYKAQTPPPP